jgi:hypothetical protein
VSATGWWEFVRSGAPDPPIERSCWPAREPAGVKQVLTTSSVPGPGWLAQAQADSGYVAGLLGPTLLIAVGIGLVFPTLMAAATADVPEGDAGTPAAWPTPPVR